MMDYFLGIDPSTVSTGYALLDKNKKLIRYGVITPPATLNHQDKLRFQYEIMETLMRAYPIKAIVCEDQFNGPNVDTLKKISRTASMVMLLAAQLGMELHMTYPVTWRLAFHGTGKADKADTIKLVNETFDLQLKTKQNDIADAIGMAVTCWKLYNVVQD